MTRHGSARRRALRTQPATGPGTLPVGVRGALAAGGALLVGVWLGVAVGLATRKRQDQPSGPPVYVGPDAIGGPEERGGG
jgi:hypothetical protein